MNNPISPTELGPKEEFYLINFDNSPMTHPHRGYILKCKVTTRQDWGVNAKIIEHIRTPYADSALSEIIKYDNGNHDSYDGKVKISKMKLTIHTRHTKNPVHVYRSINGLADIIRSTEIEETENLISRNILAIDRIKEEIHTTTLELDKVSAPGFNLNAYLHEHDGAPITFESKEQLEYHLSEYIQDATELLNECLKEIDTLHVELERIKPLTAMQLASIESI